MTKFIFLFIATLLLAGCLKNNEVKEMVNDLKDQKKMAQDLIVANKFTTDDRLLIHEYFFNFAEKVHLMKADVEAAKEVQKIVAKAKIENFCDDFVLAKEHWAKLNEYCQQDDFYACTDEMKEFPMIMQVFKKLMGEKLEAAANKTKSCFN